MKLIIAAALLLPLTAATAAPPAAEHQSRTPVGVAPAEKLPSNPMNVHSEQAGCKPIFRQVQEANKRPIDRSTESRTLNQEPPAHLLLAVDRHVGGCREVTFVRRNVAPGSTMPVLGDGSD